LDIEAKDKTHYLYPGGLFTSAEPYRVTTVLGSCVAVCLWDAEHKIGGINHYLLPLWNGEGLPTPRYGNIAITRLIEKLLLLGCSRKGLRAKVFGGASMLENNRGLLAVGERNISLAISILEEQRIPVISNDVGGCVGRKIIFDTATGTVLLRRNRGLNQLTRTPDEP